MANGRILGCFLALSLCYLHLANGLISRIIPKCEWTSPPPGDSFPKHVNVLATPLVANLPHNSGPGVVEIIIVSYNYTDGGAESAAGTDPRYFGVIRILNGKTCEQLESIHDPNYPIIAASPPAIGDLDGDGIPEIVTHKAGIGMVAFKWNAAQNKYTTFWATSASDAPMNGLRWDGPAIHDLNDDGFPEVISSSEVYNGRTGARINTGQRIAGNSPYNGNQFSVVGDFDGDGHIELVANGIQRWNRNTNRWELAYSGIPNEHHYAVADFGTPGATAAQFDWNSFDGIAEVASIAPGQASLYTLNGQLLFRVTGLERGGPPIIGDFDLDGYPEFASADANANRVFDVDCAGGGPGCNASYIRWAAASQDKSSASTGSSVFRFEQNEEMHMVYADECFLRVYKGLTGEVLFSTWRSSCTWHENPIIANVDDDEGSELLVNSNNNCNVNCPTYDPIHRGLNCQSNQECPSGVCNNGYCRCNTDNDCDSNTRCTTPIPGTPGTGNTCRAYHPPASQGGLTGVRVMMDGFGVWRPSRSIWNQHTYSITNVYDNGTIPRTSQWKQNHRMRFFNTYRANRAVCNNICEHGGVCVDFDECDCTGTCYYGNFCETYDVPCHEARTTTTGTPTTTTTSSSTQSSTTRVSGTTQQSGTTQASATTQGSASTQSSATTQGSATSQGSSTQGSGTQGSSTQASGSATQGGTGVTSTGVVVPTGAASGATGGASGTIDDVVSSAIKNAGFSLLLFAVFLVALMF